MKNFARMVCSWFSFLLLSVMVCPIVHLDSAQAFDLGGPCGYVDKKPGVMWARPEYKAAEKAGDWETILKLDTLEVRRDCRADYNWVRLARPLIKLRRYVDASEVIKKAFGIDNDLTPKELIFYPEVREFISSREFQETPFGKEYLELKKKNDALVAEFKAKIAKIPKSQRPPEVHIEEEDGVWNCRPGSTWTVKKDANLLDRPNGKRTLAKLVIGEKTRLISVQEHTKPQPVGVVLGDGDFKTGDVFWYITRIVEMSDIYWKDGILTHEDLPFPYIKEFCLRPRPRCAAQFVEPIAADGQVNWFKVTNKNGIQGWVKNESVLEPPYSGCD